MRADEPLNYISHLKTPLECETVMKNAKVKVFMMQRSDENVSSTDLPKKIPTIRLFERSMKPYLLAKNSFVRNMGVSTSRRPTRAGWSKTMALNIA
jgi:hypothetical protein